MTIPDQNTRAREVILELIRRLNISKDHLSNMMREDINYLRGRLDLLEYLLTPTSGAKIDNPKDKADLGPLNCNVCGGVISTLYHHRGIWYCSEHLPRGMTWPIGMHGNDLKAYKDRK